MKKLLMILVLLVSACDAKENEAVKSLTINYRPGINENLTPEYISKIEMALNILKNKCPNLFVNALGDVESAQAWTYPTEGTYKADEYGWKEDIEVTIKLKDNLNFIPSSYLANGHNLFFYLGAGKLTGIVTDKEVTQKICGWEVSPNGSNMFEAVPALEILK